MANRFLPFVRWIWSKRDHDVAFRQSTVTASNNDASLPKPPLTDLEALQFFRFLEDRKLIFPLKGDPTAFGLNAVEDFKWNEVKKELKKGKLRRSAIYINTKKILFYIVVTIVSAFLGASIGLSTQDIYKHWVIPTIQKISGAPPQEGANGSKK